MINPDAKCYEYRGTPRPVTITTSPPLVPVHVISIHLVAIA